MRKFRSQNVFCYSGNAPVPVVIHENLSIRIDFHKRTRKWIFPIFFIIWITVRQMTHPIHTQTHTKKYFFNGCLQLFPFYLIDPIAFSSYSFETIKSGTFID